MQTRDPHRWPGRWIALLLSCLMAVSLPSCALLTVTSTHVLPIETLEPNRRPTVPVRPGDSTTAVITSEDADPDEPQDDGTRDTAPTDTTEPSPDPGETTPGGSADDPSNGFDDDRPAPHVHQYGSWQATADGHYKTCTGCGEVAESGDHTPSIVPGSIPTCGEEGLSDGEICSVCRFVLIEQTPIPATERHTYSSAGMRLPTLKSPGYLSGQECVECHHIPDGTQTIPAYIDACDTYAYEALAGKPNGANLQRFYQALFNACLDYHEDVTADATYDLGNDLWVAVKISYATYGISADESFLVLRAINADCPLFYWINGKVLLGARYMEIGTDSAYIDGQVRAEYNQLIYDSLVATWTPNDPLYEQVLRLHDRLTEDMIYAREDDGVTPEDAAWAHDIMGYFLYGKGVCECYAELTHLYLTYWGVENILVTGVAGGVNHAWNLVQMDDDEWYWFDITWDDQPTTSHGRIYDYFCQTDNAFAGRSVDIDLYALPDRATAAYTGTVPTIDTTFQSGSFTYRVMGYRQVELTAVTGFGSVTVPTQVAYAGTVYEVASVGNTQNGSLATVFSRLVTAVHLPATVRYIQPNALHGAGVSQVTLDPANPYLLMDGNAIYRQDPCVLLYYLPYATDTVWTLRADTVGIENYAILQNNHLETVVLPASLTYIRAGAIYSCTSLTTIRYTGTPAQWAAIQLADTALPAGVTVQYG